MALGPRHRVRRLEQLDLGARASSFEAWTTTDYSLPSPLTGLVYLRTGQISGPRASHLLVCGDGPSVTLGAYTNHIEYIQQSANSVYYESYCSVDRRKLWVVIFLQLLTSGELDLSIISSVSTQSVGFRSCEGVRQRAYPLP